MKKHDKNYTALNAKKKQHEWIAPQGYIEAISVEKAAEKLRISELRVRKMLADGVLKGTKHSRTWRVDYPFNVRIGTRGPASQAFKDRSVTPKTLGLSRPNNLFNNQKIKKGV
jgi:hypothetical protein